MDRFEGFELGDTFEATGAQEAEYGAGGGLTMRLAARVADLRADGYRILSVQTSHDGKRFARYILEEQPEQLGAGL